MNFLQVLEANLLGEFALNVLLHGVLGGVEWKDAHFDDVRREFLPR